MFENYIKEPWFILLLIIFILFIIYHIYYHHCTNKYKRIMSGYISTLMGGMQTNVPSAELMEDSISGVSGKLEALTNVPYNEKEVRGVPPGVFSYGATFYTGYAINENPQTVQPTTSFKGEEIPTNLYMLDDGNNGMLQIADNQCSPACCSPQYPLPFSMGDNGLIPPNTDPSKFIQNEYTCNNAWQGAGCSCMNKKQAKFIGARGTNA